MSTVCYRIPCIAYSLGKHFGIQDCFLSNLYKLVLTLAFTIANQLSQCTYYILLYNITESMIA